MIQYVEGQTAEQSIGENFEKWSLNEISVEESDEDKGVFRVCNNCYVFDPQATKYFIADRDREREFVTKFIKKHENIRYALHVLFSDNRSDTGQLEGFCRRLNASINVEFEARRIEPKEATENYVMVAADKRAIPYIKRAIAKIAFHSFLYWYRDFNGDEPIFEGIRSFISKHGDHQTSTGEDFVTGLDVQGNFFSSSNEHYHIFRFYVDGENIVCQIIFFTGLCLDVANSETPEPLASEIILAGDSGKARGGIPEVRGVPFYVHGKSQLKRRILPVSDYPQMILP